MQITQDTQIMISLWTLIACWFFLWKLSSNITKFQKEVEMEIKDHEKRLTSLEDLDLKAILEKIQTNIERIMKKMDENHR